MVLPEMATSLRARLVLVLGMLLAGASDAGPRISMPDRASSAALMALADRCAATFCRPRVMGAPTANWAIPARRRASSRHR